MDDVMKGAKNTTNPEDLIDFMIVAGDNIYAADPLNPTDEEFD
jgi:phosphodiesterase/alkaline phosphatase D-like protein